MESGSVVGLIAGSGRLPEILAEAIKAKGHRLLWLTVGAEVLPPPPIADYQYHLRFGQLSQVPQILQSHQVRDVLLAGRVPRAALFTVGEPALSQDRAPLGDRRDQAILVHVAHLLGQMGITVISPLQFVGDLAVSPGVHTRRAPSETEWRDIHLGMPVARAVAALDVGQTVALKDGVILAVEAAEGTDATIQRAGAMVEGIRVIKAARPSQDERFDLPTIGAQTIDVLVRARAALLAVEARKTLLLDPKQTLAAADAAGIAFIGVEPSIHEASVDMPSG